MKTLTLWILTLLLILMLFPPAQARVWEFGGAAALERRFGFWNDPIQVYPFRGHVGTFISRNIAIGSFVNMGLDDEEDYSRLEIELGPRVSYYFDEQGIGYPFVWTRASYGYINYDHDFRGEYTDHHYTVLLGGGYMYMINDFNGVNIGAYFEQHWYDFHFRGWESGQKIGLQLGFLLWVY